MDSWAMVKQHEDNIREGRAIAIVWTMLDIQVRANQRGIHLSEDEARSVLDSLYRKHDANIGISWDVIDIYIDNV